MNWMSIILLIIVLVAFVVAMTIVRFKEHYEIDDAKYEAAKAALKAEYERSLEIDKRWETIRSSMKWHSN